MRRALISIVLLVAAVQAFGTASLNIEAGPYAFILAIGGANGNEISTITIGSESDGKQWSINASDCVKVKYDQQQKHILIRYKPIKGQDSPPAFFLRIKGYQGSLKVRGTRFDATSDWEM